MKQRPGMFRDRSEAIDRLLTWAGIALLTFTWVYLFVKVVMGA